MHTILKRLRKEVTIGIDKPFVMIGEKINPTGNKKLAAALQAGNLDAVASWPSGRWPGAQMSWTSMWACRASTKSR